MAPSKLRIEVEQGDVTTFAADALILKYANGFHGADEAVALHLGQRGARLDALACAPGATRTVEGAGALGARKVVFVGTPRLGQFTYREVGQVVRLGLAALAGDPGCRHVALTLHGTGIGLDEHQAFLSELKAVHEALAERAAPPNLEAVTFVERNASRAKRLAELLEVSPVPTLGAPTPAEDPDQAQHIFVAMPFSKETDDVFYYGIQKPIHAAGFLCERIDHATFTGDIVDRICQQIESAELVIADCTGANPNVYLEIGYAWGKGRPTLLLARGEKELRFDVRGHRAIFYDRIIDLETALAKELARLPRPRSPRA